MKVDLHILTYNESSIIGFVLDYYARFCRNMYVYDNHSSDDTKQIAVNHGAIVKTFGDKTFSDLNNMNLKNECWRGSSAEYVIVCDADEVLFHNEMDYRETPKGIIAYPSDPRKYLHDNRHCTMFKTIGWQIMSNEMPKDDLLEITNGYEFSNYAKNIIFNPKAIKEINYNPGAHRCNPVGDVVWSEDSLYVLHYKHIGGVERTIKRYKEYQKRMSSINKKKGWGIHYNQSPSQLRREWDERMKISKPLV